MVNTICNCGTIDEALEIVMQQAELARKAGNCPLWIMQIAAAYRCMAVSAVAKSIEGDKEFMKQSPGYREGMDKQDCADAIFSAISSEMADHWNERIKRDATEAS